MNIVKNDDVLARSLDYIQNVQVQSIPVKELLYLSVSFSCVHDIKIQIGYLPLPWRLSKYGAEQNVLNTLSPILHYMYLKACIYLWIK
jgi:hypothetical protein